MIKVYDIKYSPKAERYLKKMRDKGLKKAFKEALREIALDPFSAGEPKKGNLAGIYCYDIYYQQTNYEIAYYINEDEQGNLIIIVLAGTRENFYKELNRYIKKNKPK